ncbi:hypothetical protein [Moorena sp. SIO4G3]|uniref:hypothetical protein n=1 Tax=Moorena sp. SIO4G3 TaxID=2607821 RepID=UPI0025F983D7|nr:hypothetical protein [Moorena sp. SIO4G3]
MGETTAVAHGGDPQDRTASPRPRCIANLLTTSHKLSTSRTTVSGERIDSKLYF